MIIKSLLLSLLMTTAAVAGGSENTACFKFIAAHPDTNQPHLEDSFDMKLISPAGYAAEYKNVRSFKTCVPRNKARYAAYIKRHDSPAWADGIEFWGENQPDYKEIPLYVR